MKIQQTAWRGHHAQHRGGTSARQCGGTGSANSGNEDKVQFWEEARLITGKGE